MWQWGSPPLGGGGAKGAATALSLVAARKPISRRGEVKGAITGLSRGAHLRPWCEANGAATGTMKENSVNMKRDGAQ
jgi:hypothetical protein